MAKINATIYFLTRDSDEINQNGWECEAGKNYCAARFEGDITRGVYEPAARIVADDLDPETIWAMTQNLDTPWSDLDQITCITECPRSMDVSDYIVFDHEPNVAYVVAPAGFTTVTLY